MNDISTILTRCERSLRDASNAICRPDIREQDAKALAVALTSMWALSQDGLDWLAKHTAERNQTGQPDETHYAHEEESKPDWSQKYRQSEPDIQILRKQVKALHYRVLSIEDQLLQSQKQNQPYAGAKLNIQPEVVRAWQDIRERAEAETMRNVAARVETLHVASRSSKVY